MPDTLNFSSNIITHDSTDVPSGWLDCQRKSTIIAKKFIAFKTPLDDQFKPSIPPEKRWTCAMLIKYIKEDRKNLGLVINLTNTERFYLSNTEFTKKDVHYEKIPYELDEIPNDEQIDRFIKICDKFISTNPNDIIGVHSTYDFNRSGFLICAYLCQKLDYSIQNAIALFATARPPGINKRNYLDKLVQIFSNHNLTPILSSSAECCLQNNQSRVEIQIISNQDVKPRFAVNLSHVIPICYPDLLNYIRSKYQQMCNWKRQSFPGSKPVSMNDTNYETILKSPYMVSWKADGTRYMMLIENENEIYMLDRSNNIFQINNLRFPKHSDFSKHLTNTLVDGEFVIDNHNGIDIYRYLVYDIVVYENEYVGQKQFNERLGIISHCIVNVRNDAISQGLIDKNSEPFSIRIKEFWELKTASELLGVKFQSQLSHRSDGLIFQPKLDPYQFGRSSNVLKWDKDNTIDFRLKIITIEGSQDKSGQLYLNNVQTPFAYLRYSPVLDKYDNQIIECSYRNNEWNFNRHRPDKSYPNTQATADGIIKALENPITEQIIFSLIDESIAFDNYQ